MRYFQDIKTAYSEVKRDLAEMGIVYESATVQDKVSGEETIELMNYGFTITQPNYMQSYDYCVKSGINEQWLRTEMKSRLEPPVNPGTAWLCNKQFWKQFLRDGCFSYTYSERMWFQLSRVIYELSLHPNTRQAIITMYDQHQDLMNWGGRDRIPCSMHYQFLLRQEKLHLMYVMRSCDLIKFFLPDYTMAVGLLEHVADQTHNRVGSITMVIGSLHAFQSDVEEIF